MSFPLIKAVKESRTLVKFEYGEDVTVYATTWKSPVFFEGNEYRPEPGIEIKMPTQSGGLNEDSLEVTLPITREAVHAELRSMAVGLYSPRAVPKTRIEVFQLIDSEEGQRTVYLYEGTLEKSRSNPSGDVGKVILYFQSELRYGLDRITLGRRCDPECDVRFGGPGCRHPRGDAIGLFDSSTLWPNHVPVDQNTVRSGWVDVTVDPNEPRRVEVTLNNAAHPGGISAREQTISYMPQDYWIGSFLIDKNGSGLSIPVQSWQRTSNQFVLSQVPPASWDGSVLFLQVDCPKTLYACSARFNTDRFNGLGYGIPDYNPALNIRKS